jgi:hypothetical protein
MNLLNLIPHTALLPYTSPQAGATGHGRTRIPLGAISSVPPFASFRMKPVVSLTLMRSRPQPRLEVRRLCPTPVSCGALFAVASWVYR